MMETKPTRYADINELLGQLLARIQSILGEKLVGLYPFGSLVAGDFDYRSSDIDVVAAIASELDDNEFRQLEAMHLEMMNRYNEWDNRLEIGYIAVEHLGKVETFHPIALISPGEPFHVKVAENDWILNRAVLYEKGIPLYGPSPQVICTPISQELRMWAIRVNVQRWRNWVEESGDKEHRPGQAYMILTMCRMLYTFRQGGFVSKKQAALWAMQELPEWSALIQDALRWRDDFRNEDVEHSATIAETLRFTRFVLDECESAPDMA